MNGWWPLGIAAILYVTQGCYYLTLSDRGMALTFFAYALANVGLSLDYISKAG